VHEKGLIERPEHAAEQLVELNRIPSLSLLNKTVRRLFANDRERHYLLLPEYGFTFARVPKAANSAIKLSLYHLLFNSRGRVPNVNRDAFWQNLPDERARLLSAAELMRDAPDTFIFAFTRNPYSRVASCYYDKLVTREGEPAPDGWAGFAAGIGFADFVEQVAELDDEAIDLHLRSQVSILTHEGRLMPHFIGKVERVVVDWLDLTRKIKARGGPRLRQLPIVNRTHNRRPPTPELFADPALERLVRKRYRADFETFYPDLDAPVDDLARPTPPPRPGVLRRQGGARARRGA